MKIILVLLALFSICCKAQGDDFFKGKLIEIISSNEFKILEENENIMNVVLSDTRIYNDKDIVKKSRVYLNENILNTMVIFYVEKSDQDNIFGTLLYNCKKQENLPKEFKDMPCTSANQLNVEMLQLRYLEYVGTNEFLKGISEGKGIPLLKEKSKN